MSRRRPRTDRERPLALSPTARPPVPHPHFGTGIRPAGSVRRPGMTTAQDAHLESFRRDGFVIFDPEIPTATLDGAVADVELGPRRRWLRFQRRKPSWDPARAT